jgi:ubiquinone/menaquinone biosynthesis C-methylase UbiE
MGAASWRVFDQFADRYDAWFDTSRGRALLASEVACLRSLLPADLTGWVEVGVGTGRFAEALGIAEGIDPAGAVLEKAARRGIHARKHEAERLPYPDASLPGILLVVTLCFLANPRRAMLEFARVLKAGGQLVVGIVPAGSAWGALYRHQAGEGHPFYSVARFYTCRETKELAASAGLEFVRASSTLPMAPGEPLQDIPVLDGAGEGYGFVAMLFSSPSTGGARR